MIVYKITNKINNKVYIGITSRKNGFKGRYSSRGKGIERVYNFHLQCKERGDGYNIHLFRSIEKYGFDNFEVDEEFDIAMDIEELKEKEKYWIEYYKSYDPQYGYNNTKGGDGVDGNVISVIKRRRKISNENGIIKIGYCGSDKIKKQSVINKLCKNNKNTGVYICRMCGKLYVKEYGDIKKGFCDDCIEYEEYYDDIVNILGKLPKVEEYEKTHYKKSPRKYYSVPFVSSFVITKKYCETQTKITKSEITKSIKIAEEEYRDMMHEIILNKIADEKEKKLFEKSIGILSIDEIIELNKKGIDEKEYYNKITKEYKDVYDEFIKKYWGEDDNEYNI